MLGVGNKPAAPAPPLTTSLAVGAAGAGAGATGTATCITTSSEGISSNTRPELKTLSHYT